MIVVTRRRVTTDLAVLSVHYSAAALVVLTAALLLTEKSGAPTDTVSGEQSLEGSRRS
jgi:hypothetical protein